MARQGDIHPLPMARAMAGSALTATHRPRTRGFHGAVDPRTLFLYVIVFLLGLAGGWLGIRVRPVGRRIRSEFDMASEPSGRGFGT